MVLFPFSRIFSDLHPIKIIPDYRIIHQSSPRPNRGLRRSPVGAEHPPCLSRHQQSSKQGLPRLTIELCPFSVSDGSPDGSPCQRISGWLKTVFPGLIAECDTSVFSDIGILDNLQMDYNPTISDITIPLAQGYEVCHLWIELIFCLFRPRIRWIYKLWIYEA